MVICLLPWIDAGCRVQQAKNVVLPALSLSLCTSQRVNFFSANRLLTDLVQLTKQADLQ